MFAMFCFVGLAAVKRYASAIQILGVSAMVMSVLVLLLYLRSPEISLLYRHTNILWLICPVMLYWFGRIWIVAGRGEMHSDPILFAPGDRPSLVVAGVIVAIGFLSR